MLEAAVIKTVISLCIYHPHKQLKNHQRLNIQTLIATNLPSSYTVQRDLKACNHKPTHTLSILHNTEVSLDSAISEMLRLSHTTLQIQLVCPTAYRIGLSAEYQTNHVHFHSQPLKFTASLPIISMYLSQDVYRHVYAI